VGGKEQRPVEQGPREHLEPLLLLRPLRLNLAYPWIEPVLLHPYSLSSDLQVRVEV